jgi:hypothetical protein
MRASVCVCVCVCVGARNTQCLLPSQYDQIWRIWQNLTFYHATNTSETNHPKWFILFTASNTLQGGMFMKHSLAEGRSRCLRACRQKCDRNTSFVVLAVVLMNSQVFWDVYDLPISKQLQTFRTIVMPALSGSSSPRRWTMKMSWKSFTRR